MNFRLASQSDLGDIMALIGQAKEHLRGLGIDQWQDGYPDENVILEDIDEGSGYILWDNGKAAGYVCVSFGGEESYKVIRGRWKSGQAYAVVHRMAVDKSCRGRGLRGRMFEFAEELCGAKDIHSIRVDTHEENLAMRHILEKHRYEYCGIIRVGDGDRIAFEKTF